VNNGRYILRKILSAIPLLLGVTLISFWLMVYAGADQTYAQLGKNPDSGQVAELRQQLGYDRPFVVRYMEYLGQLLTLDLGHSDTTGEPVGSMLMRTLPVSLALVLPGFLLGNLLGIALGMAAAWRRGEWIDRVIMSLSVVGMSISFVIIIIGLQILLCTPWGFNLFPSRGWEVHDLLSYLEYVTVPTLAMVFVTLGYNTRFYRSVMVEELQRDHVQTLRAFGASTGEILLGHTLKNSMVPVLTRIMFSIPLVVISGSLLIESYFGIPGIGLVTFEAITGGDQPVLKAIVGLTAVLFVIAQTLTDLFYRVVDPRITDS
jgi:peptide/nickel transport system permease protein